MYLKFYRGGMSQLFLVKRFAESWTKCLMMVMLSQNVLPKLIF